MDDLQPEIFVEGVQFVELLASIEASVEPTRNVETPLATQPQNQGRRAA